MILSEWKILVNEKCLKQEYHYIQSEAWCIVIGMFQTNKRHTNRLIAPDIKTSFDESEEDHRREINSRVASFWEIFYNIVFQPSQICRLDKELVLQTNTWNPGTGC